MNALKAAKILVLYGTVTALVGWSLSFAGCLDTGTYALFLLLGMVAGLYWLTTESPTCMRQVGRKRISSRYSRRILPFVFVVLSLLALIGGLLHAPANFDGLTYRGSRVLHWIANGGWEWIHTSNERMNTRGSAFEWMTVPFYLLLKSDRLLFLLNWFSFLMIPGLCFRLFRACKMGKRMSWQWMWLIPMGYGYLLQAGSIGNDAIGAVLFLLSLVLLLPPKGRRVEASDLAISLLAIGLTTGLKATNLVLGLPWIILFIRQWPSFKGKWKLLIAGGTIGLAVSFVPTALLNLKHAGDWSGMSVENNEIKMSNSLHGIIGNSILITSQNLQPVVFPGASSASSILQKMTPDSLEKSFPPRCFSFIEFQMEESAGLGMALSWLLIFGLLSAGKVPQLPKTAWFLVLASYLAISVFMAQSALSTAARMLLPCYPLLVMPLLASIHPRIFKTNLWRCGLVVVFVTSIGLVLTTPPRPILPIRTVLDLMENRLKDQAVFQRIKTVYDVYGNRGNGFAPLLARLPADSLVLGFYSSGDAPETTLWKPLGHRRLVHVLEGDTARDLDQRKLRWVVVSDLALQLNNRTLVEWLKACGGEVRGSVSFQLKASHHLERWYIVERERVSE